MLVFYLISLPLTLGMVMVTLQYFAGPDVPRYVLFTVAYAWFCSLSIIVLVPADIWTAAQAMSTQMSKRDPLRPYMDVIDSMLHQMLREDPSFKPSGGRLGENDMDYDTDDKTMAALRRQLRRAREEYYRYKSEYMTYVMEALELEDAMKNYVCRDSNEWKYVSSFRGSRRGNIGSFLDIMEFLWHCMLSKQLQKLLAVILGCMSAAILLAEATLLPSGVDLSLFSILVRAVRNQEVLVQIAAFVPLMYMCICTYYSLFKIGMLMFYSLTPRQTSSVSLLMICSMVARYAPPISYNFLNLIRLGGDAKTIFEKRMGNIDDAVPFFGRGFNKIYPLIMVIYTLLVASNFFGQVIDYFGSRKWFKLQSEQEDMDGFDPSGMIILQKGHLVNYSVQDRSKVEMRAVATTSMGSGKGNQSKPLKEEGHRFGTSLETIASKYAMIRWQQGSQSSMSKENDTSPASVSLLNAGNAEKQSDGLPMGPSTRLASTWASMKTGLQNFKANIGARKFLPLHQALQTLHSRVSSSESLDEIFQRLKQHPKGGQDLDLDFDDDDDDM
ncbi:LMBR1 domain-containing protein 2 [Cocos nucifera]|nr:LMBR1 domain-containing protein 2 [Cocos nucifera]